MKGKQHVTDADVAAEIRRVAPGATFADVKAAVEVVCRRLGSRDDDKTVAAFREVLDRYRAELTAPSDREAAEQDAETVEGLADFAYDRVRDIVIDWRQTLNGNKYRYEAEKAHKEIKNKIESALDAARGDEKKNSESFCRALIKERDEAEANVHEFQARVKELEVELGERQRLDRANGTRLHNVVVENNIAQKRVEALEEAGREMIAAVVQITGMYDRRAAGKISEGQVVVITEAKRKLAALVAEEVER